ncbi:hypothetical protein D1164_03405 [Mariniphaga sediminis]|uniref:Uncharacterized protein n=1 Tax=Mariniphaga sediminis TaxID=1628158 RepID=A0A399D622_9BACT|nr:hypothetical protein D1164_03405 [Mariniphaga sediminis]
MKSFVIKFYSNLIKLSQNDKTLLKNNNNVLLKNYRRYRIYFLANGSLTVWNKSFLAVCGEHPCFLCLSIFESLILHFLKDSLSIILLNTYRTGYHFFRKI